MTVSELPNAARFELPVHLTRFIGRERELEELAKLVRSARLVTLTGAGGSGKTRLALEAAAQATASFSRVAWVDLAPIADGDLVPQQVASALAIHDRPGVTALNLVIEALRDECVLLVLDNCEHVVDACAAFAESVLRACRRVTVLATSREALGVASETAWLVPSLAAGEAIQLFDERARLALPSYVTDATNTAAAAEICRRLDGIPLAIELAAARVRVLSPEQIASRLDDAFRLLSVGSRTALPRHRTLRATMEWSYGLLATREQVVLRRLSVFAGSFSLEAAEAVCVGDPLGVEDILDGVSALVDKSLIVMSVTNGRARYRLLETVRQYGVERIDEAGERGAVSLRFAAYFVELVESIAPLIVGGPIRPGLIERLSAEHDNIRAAAAWASVDATHLELALRFVGGLGWFWYVSGQFREARQIADRALAFDASHIAAPIVGRAHLASALTAFFQGDMARAFRDFEASLPLLRNASDPVSMGTALSKYGAARLLAGELDAAIALLDEAMEFTASAAPNDITRIFAVFWRGWAAYAQGDLDTARELVSNTLAVGRAFSLPTTTGHALSVLAQIELARGDEDTACALVGEAVEIEVGNADGWGIANALDVITFIAAKRGRSDDAVRLLGAVDAHRKRLAVSLPGLAPRERVELVSTLRSTFASRFDALYGEGYGWSTEHTVAQALREAARHTSEFRVPAATAGAMPVDAPIVVARDDVPEQARLRVLALGPLQVFLGTRMIDSAAWGSARPRELLVYLLMHPGGRTKEQVGLAFWPEASSAQLRNSFHVTLHRLRKALGGADWVGLANDRYCVDPAMVDSFDVIDFERDVADATRAMKRQEDGASTRLERALSHFRGDFLDGEPAGDWHLEHRERLQRLYVDSLMKLGDRLCTEERHAQAAEMFRRVLARDELHEDALVALMRCQAMLGERAQALRAYRRFVDKLREELDAEPGEEAIELHEQLQQGFGAVS